MSCVVDLRNLWWAYESSGEWVLRNISLCVREKEFLLITGPTGAGKTTLARVMCGLIPRSYRGVLKGRVSILGEEVTNTRSPQVLGDVGFVSSDPEMQFLTMRVEDEIALRLRLSGVSPEEAGERVSWAIKQVGLSESILDKSPYELSSGQKQRVAIATAIATKPKLLVLDEPLSNLDWAGAEGVVKSIELLRLNQQTSIVVIEHRIDVFMQYLSRIALMLEGTLALVDDPLNFFMKLPKEFESYVRVPEIVRIWKYLVLRYPLRNENLSDESLKTHIIKLFRGLW
ncbi:MAG: ABC transporter ATP-binding protein [Zestosphaera sp.]